MWWWRWGRFSAGKGDADLTVEVARLEKVEAVHELLGRAGLRPNFGKAGEVTLKRAVMGAALKARMNEVKADEFKLDDTDVMAALGYVGRLYAKGAEGKEVKFVAAEGECPKGRVTLSLSQVPLGEALKYVAELGGGWTRVWAGRWTRRWTGFRMWINGWW